MKSATVMRSLMIALLVCTIGDAVQGQGASVDYQRAERFHADRIKALVYDGQVAPRWIGTSGRFWYLKEGPAGKEFMLVDPAQASRGAAFDHSRLAAAASRVLGASYNAQNLPFETLRFMDGGHLRLAGTGVALTCDLASYACSRIAEIGEDDTEPPTGPRPPTADGVPPRADVPSPDKTLTAYVQNHNLWVRNLKSGEAIELSRDGEHFYDYATPLPSPVLMLQQGTEEVIQTPAVFWSPDSTRIATYVMDQRNFPRLTMTQSAPRDQFRPKYFSYAYPLPVDFVLPTARLVVFDVVKRKQIAVAAKPLTQLYYGGPRVEWTADSRRFMYREIDRGYAHIRLRDVDAATGVARTILDETGDPLVDNSILVTRSFNGGREVVWSAERDGWSHLYLYDAEKATLTNQLTKGEWVVRAIDHIDETARVLYFTGAGREAGRDPVPAAHVSRQPGRQWTHAPDAGRRRSHGVVLSRWKILRRRVLAARLADDLCAPPCGLRSGRQRARKGGRLPADRARLAHARTVQGQGGGRQDGSLRVDLAPDQLRSQQEIPRDREHLYRAAERLRAEDLCRLPPSATGHRGARLHHGLCGWPRHGASVAGVPGLLYKNLGQGSGGDDHITVFKQMAAKYPYMDLTRVGVWGHSAGGYDSTHAILTHPEFYKVAVSSAGCHDNRMDKATWNEQWMGWPVDKHYEEQSNYTLAPNLQGKLFLAHGDVDENVPLPATIKLVDALVTANKDFDFLIMPNRMHGFGNDPYFVRRRWDYFVRHLLNVEPRGNESTRKTNSASN